jgi:hypothetical protein
MSSFTEFWSDFRAQVTTLLAEGDAAAAEERGYKAAHKRMRKASLDVGKQLVALRQQSTSVTNATSEEVV